MKSFKDFRVDEAKLEWKQKWTLTLDSKGKKVYDWISPDGKWILSLTGYDGVVGKSFPHGSKKTSWMVTNVETDTPIRTTFSTLGKAKKYVEEQ
jgi:hypothetical protein